MSTVVLLNPPGTDTYIRDYFCSKVSQANYITPPLDLLMLSGTLSSRHTVHYIDAIAGHLPADEAIREISSLRPDILVVLMGAASVNEDVPFLVKFKQLYPAVRIIGLGDLFRENAAGFMREHPFLEAIVNDFTSDDILRYLDNDNASLQAMVYRSPADQSIIEAPVDFRRRTYSIPVPRHELFLQYPYRYPFFRNKAFMSVLTDFGCPYKCQFCVMGTLPYKERDLDNVMEELRAVTARGVTNILFSDQTFGANNERTEQLCRRITAERLNIRWECITRVDVVSPAMLDLLKAAGCRTIILGVESGSDEILRRSRKGYTVAQILPIIEYCRKIGIETVGTFILGLPGENASTMRETLSLLKKIPLDYASFNVAVPRAGTPLRKYAIEHRLVDELSTAMDQSGSTIAMPSLELSKEEILAFRKKAVRTFYLRPRYIVRQLGNIRSMPDLAQRVYQAINLFFRMVVS